MSSLDESRADFCIDHGPEATGYLKALIGDNYHYSEKPVFKALWDNYNDCQFVDDDGETLFLFPVLQYTYESAGDVIFYRDRKGQLTRALAKAEQN